MINLLIADDEPIILNGLSKIIDFEKLGFKLVGKAPDGQEALDIIHNNPVDVVITDIQMPFLNGLELIQKIKEEERQIYCILLTGYSEFEYAQKAIELGVYSYLLKPVDPVELTNLLNKIKDEINSNLHKERYIQTLEKHMEQLPEFITVSQSPKDRYGDLMFQADQYILDHFCEKDFSLLKASKAVGFEATYFSKIFKQEKDMSFIDYIINLRIHKAKELLANPEYTISEVCEMVGYENYSHFSTLFKKKVGVSPSKFRENMA